MTKLALTRSLLCTGSALAGLAAVMAMPAAAQQAGEGAAADMGTAGDAIVVTGTRIARDPNEQAPSPVQTLGAEQLRATGVADVTEALREIPALSNSGTIADSLERGDGGVGQATLDLRGLGAERTLVVVNGKRHVSGVTDTQIVDVATIPAALIDRVEVLTGGASAVYGADAVTGVVNYVLKQDYDGLELNARNGISSRGDGATHGLSAVFGRNFADGRGNITVFGGFSQIDEIRMGARDYTANNARYNSGLTYANPARRFQQGDISQGGTPSFHDYYNIAAGRFGYGYAVPLPGTAAYDAVFAGAAPTAAEQALIDRALQSPSLAFAAFPAFAISSNAGVVSRADYGAFGADVNGNGVGDCDESYIGHMFGGCYVTTQGGGVRIFRDGVIATTANQYGGDGAVERVSAQSLIPENTRYNAEIMGSYEFSPAAELFVDAKYVRSETRSQNPYNTFYDALYVAPDNPTIPTALQADAAEAGGLLISRDFLDLGPNNVWADRDTYRVVAGLRGELGDGIGYEVFGNYGRTDSKVTQQNTVLPDRLFAALDAVDQGVFLTGTANGNIVCRSSLDPSATPVGTTPVADAGFFTFNPGDGSCAAMNLFNGANSVSAAAAGFITVPTTDRARIEQLQFGASVTGDTRSFFELPGGPVGFAGGVEYRKEKSRFDNDPLNLGILPVTTPVGEAGSFIGDVSDAQSLGFDGTVRYYDSTGSYDVWDLFGEVRLPILADRPFVERLELDAAARYSDYSTVGGAFTWNVNGVWSPVEDITLRATYAQAIRAPNIFELFGPQQGAFFRPADPCDAAQVAALGASDAAAGERRQANCLAAGLPAGYTDPLAARFSGTSGGNPDLQEETAKTWTAGAVITPRWVPGLVISGDYYHIEIENAIASVAAQDIVDGCYDSASFPNQYCGLFDRRADGGLSFLRQTQLNFGAIRTAGVDVSLSYSRDIGPVEWGLRANANWVDHLDQLFDPADPTAIDPELGETGRPEWTVSGGTSIGWGPVTLSYSLQWIDSQALAGVEIETADIIAGAAGFADDVFVHDLAFSVSVDDDRATVYAGINNFTDVEPYPTNSAYPVNPYGRYFFVGVTFRP